MRLNFHLFYKESYIRLMPLSVSLLLLLSLLILAGCQPKSPLRSAMQDYQSRLTGVLDTSFPTPLPNQNKFIAKADLKVVITPIEINLRELYAINSCKLALLIANRNSALGKVQLPSQRFIYDHDLLEAFAPCIEKIALSHPQLAKKLVDLKNQKERNYLASWVNMFQQSNEVYSALTRTQKFLVSKNSATYEQSVQDWSWVIRLQFLGSEAIKGQALSKKLENTLKRIANRRLPASLWGSEYFVYSELSSMNTVLSEQLPLVNCKQGKASEQAKILRNVFVLFFVKKIQPIGSSINTVHYSFIPIIETLPKTTLSRKLQSDITSKMTSEFLNYQSSIKRHIALWQTFLKRCDLLPVRPT